MEMSAEELNALGRRLAAGEPSEEDLGAFHDYRDGFGEALDDLEAELWNIAPSVHALQIGTRLKNVTSVIPKLRRKRGVPLAEMQDIAGARIVVPSLAEVEEVRAQFADARLERTNDYRADGVKHGYRALHLILRQVPDKAVELQIRTQVQNEWANTSEFLSHRFGLGVKSAGGPTEVHAALSELSDRGRSVDLLRAERVRLGRGLAEMQREMEVGVASSQAHLNDQAFFLRKRLGDLAELSERVYHELTAFREQARLLQWMEIGG